MSSADPSPDPEPRVRPGGGHPDATRPRPADPPGLRRRLLRWFDAHRRDLPWRRTRDPWSILVSEIMLQQTTVSAVVPYYERLLLRWPDPAALAAAPLDELLAEWAGLGYYRRARNLHAAASVVAETGGTLPADAAGLAELPGIGPYTAAAVASIAHGEPVAAVDGNVERVLTRLLALPGDPARGTTRRAIRDAAGALLARRRPGDFNQALMELGATICRPRSPDCPRCPIRRSCAALAAGEPERYPETPPRSPPTPVTRVCALVVRRGKLLLERRTASPNEGFLELPAVDVPAPERTRDGAPRDGAATLARELQRRLGLTFDVAEPLAVHRHAITRYRIRVHPYRGSLSSGRVRDPLAWISPCVTDRPLTTATRRILAVSVPDLLAP